MIALPLAALIFGGLLVYAGWKGLSPTALLTGSVKRSENATAFTPSSGAARTAATGEGVNPPLKTGSTRRPPSTATTGKALPGGVRELFYDPRGAYDEGRWIAPIGGHSDHVHVSFGDRASAVRIIDYARALGLRVSENPYAEGGAWPEKGVHTATSYHYQYFPGKVKGYVVGRALDASGEPSKMAALFDWIKREYLS